ncbi:MAG: VWA domain-containing protein [Bacteroidota bacterium]
MKTKTIYQLLVDASGSMSNLRHETLEAINSQILSIRSLAKEVKEQEVLVSLCFFNTDTRNVYSSLHPDQAPILELSQYRTDGSTALLDALGQRIEEISKSITPYDDVVMVVVTDGEENASQFYTSQQVARRISEKKESGHWTFSFLGADFDSWKVARQLNIDRDEVRFTRKSDLRHAMVELNECVSDFVHAKEAGMKKKGLFKKEDQSGKA